MNLDGFWRLADPKISITSAAAMVIGAALAAREGPLSWGWLIILGLALFFMEVAKNAWGDIFDYDSGTDLRVKKEDRTSFSGGKRVLVDGLLTRRQTWMMAFGFGGAGIALGIAMVFLHEPMLVWIGIVGLILGWSYHGPPLRLAYRGLGELDVVLCYGPLITLATYTLQTHQLNVDILWLSLPLGIFIAAFLWVNEFPDYEADLAVGKRNLVVRLGRRRASRTLPLIYGLGFAILWILPWVSGLPSMVRLGLVAVPAACYVVFGVWRQPEDFYRGRPVQPAALLTFVLYSAGASVGVVIA